MSSPAHYSLLVVDDEPDLRTLYELTLLREGYDVESAASVDDAWQRLASRTYSAVITDMRLPDGSGLDLLKRLEQAKRREKAIVITAYGSAEGAVEALKAGAFDYLTKPVDLRQFRSVVASALGRAPAAPPGKDAAAVAELRPSEEPGTDPGRVHPALVRLAGRSQAMQQVRSMVERVARSMAPVLVQGESGTGKELVARAIHACSTRSDAPFIAVNCGAIPEQLLEAEFFGYRKGSFTGAHEDREGFVQAAQGGTLFLDEIGDLPLAMQSKLLRVIQERTVRPVGAVTETPINVRVLSATHKDLASEVHEGKFRQDLFYRLNVIQIRVPALRERIDDLPAICDVVLSRIADEAGISPPPRLSPQAMERLSDYAFPGNVRELENLLHRALALTTGDAIEWADLGLPDDVFVDSGIVDLDALHAASEAARKAVAAAPPGELPSDLVAYLDQVERDILIRALEQHRFNRTAAGASLGLSLRQMRYRMARLGVNVADHVGERGDSAF
ncbi:MAG TPA: sigma-54 dependent transcriptional regulator [Burkholderiaceae bacterium]|nr:sigma-54 dependent transcriptional regulator [Burkholderiaceae bacterium]